MANTFFLLPFAFGSFRYGEILKLIQPANITVYLFSIEVYFRIIIMVDL